jgi:uronate dehydrogenase
MIPTIVLTGAAGMIGRVLRAHFAERRRALLITDIRPLDNVQPNETVMTGDLSDPAFCNQLLAGAEAVVHMGGVSTNRPLDVLLPHNYLALFNLYEAARAQRVRRVVYASSNHATGMYPAGVRIDASMPVNPDSQYGLSKVWGEGLARLYWEKHALESVCLRIGSFLARPVVPRNLSTWLSHRDLCALVDASLDTPEVGFDIVYGVSANTRSWWDNSHARVDYRPQDNAEDYAAEIARANVPVDPREARLQGADYAADGYRR